MDHCGTETLQPKSHFKMAHQLTQSPLGVAQQNPPGLEYWQPLPRMLDRPVDC